jgi:DNA-binding HxlR family transcriptional regulator
MIRAGLPGITASVLTGRLAQLAQAGVVDHDPRLGIYTLTEAGGVCCRCWRRCAAGR